MAFKKLCEFKIRANKINTYLQTVCLTYKLIFVNIDVRLFILILLKIQINKYS